MSTVFEYEGYILQSNINFTGLEIDILGKHRNRDEKLIIECKAKQKPLSTEVKNFAFNVSDQDANWGYFLYTEELDHQAAGLVEIMKSKKEKYGNLVFFGPDSIIQTLVRAKFIRNFEGISFPENLLLHKVIFAYTYFGNFYIFIDANSASNKYYYLFDAETLIETEDFNVVVDETNLNIDVALKESINELSKLEHKFIREKNAKKADEIITISKKFEIFLDDVGSTFIHTKVDEISLNSLFVEPNLRKYSTEKKQRLGMDHVGLWEIIDEHNENLEESIEKNDGNVKGIRIMILGDENSSKTAIAKQVFFRYYNLGYIPIFINGANIKNIRKDQFNKEIEDWLSEQYNNITLKNINDKNRLVIIIDDFHKFGSSKKEEFVDVFIKNLNVEYNNIVLIVDPLLPLRLMLKDNKLKDIYEDYQTYKILEFGPKLRNKLVENWYTIGKEEVYIDTNELYRKFDNIERHILSIIGKNYVPSYPFYILTILQTLDAGNSQNQNYSIHGFYYEHLINQKIITVVKSKDDIGLLYNYFTELAFLFFELKKRELPIAEFNTFHDLYCDEYSVSIKSNAILRDLEQAKLIEINGSIRITYNYIYYFFVAKYLSNRLSKDKIKAIVNKMCKKVYVSEYGNIIMFLTHLSKDPYIIDELINNSKLLFENTEVLKLDKDVQHINDLVKELPTQVLELFDANDKRQDELKEREKVEMLEKEYDSEHQDFDEDDHDNISEMNVVAKMSMAVKTIEILGQLTKKYWGSMSGVDKYTLASETYFLGLRAMKAYMSLLDKNNDSVVRHIGNLITKKHIKDRFALKQEIEEAANDFVFRLCFMASFGIIKKISHSIGYDNLAVTFDQILQKNDFPSVRLIDLSVKLDHFNKLPIEQISKLRDTVSGNYLSTMLLRNLVVDYLYLFETNYKDKQRICSLLDIKIQDQRFIQNTSVVKKN